MHLQQTNTVMVFICCSNILFLLQQSNDYILEYKDKKETDGNSIENQIYEMLLIIFVAYKIKGERFRSEIFWSNQSRIYTWCCCCWISCVRSCCKRRWWKWIIEYSCICCFKGVNIVLHGSIIIIWLFEFIT